MKNSAYKLAVFLLLIAGSKNLLGQPGKKRDPDTRIVLPPPQNLNSKTIITQFVCNPDAIVYLENILRGVDIRVSSDHFVKLETTVYYQGNPILTDEKWLKKMGLEFSGNAGHVVVKSSDPVDGKPQTSTLVLSEFFDRDSSAGKKMKITRDIVTTNSVPYFDSSGNLLKRKSTSRPGIILYIPPGAKLDIDSKYADIHIRDKVKELKARITNGGLNMIDAEKLTFISSYGRLHAENIGIADVDMQNGSFEVRNIKELQIGSKNSTIELGTLKKLKLVSNVDEYEIDEIGTISGEKNYGHLKITTLLNSLDITGINADIKVRDIEQAVSLIKIDDQYADLRLPLDNLKNYTISFEGTGGNVYAPFEKTDVTASSFKGKSGNNSGPSTAFNLKCNNCTTDFK